MGKKAFFWTVAIILIVALLFFTLGNNKSSGFATLSAYDGEMTLYKSGSCGCCDVYSNYFKSKGNPNIDVVDLESVNQVKQQYNIPKALESCHTTVLGDYFVEGHIPLNAIEKLLQEKPKIKGIAMPGMPQGSPGMPGVAKEGDFVIYSVNYDGSYQEWMRI